MGQTQIAGIIGVDYTPAMMAAQKFAVSLKELNAQLKNHQTIAKMVGASVAKDFAQSMQQSNIILDRHGRVLVDLSKKTKDAGNEVEKTGRKIRNEAKKQSEMMSQLQHRYGWFVSGSIFFGAQAAFSSIVEAMAKVEYGMTSIRKVINNSTVDFRQLRDELQDLGVQYGVVSEEVLKSATVWAQAGFRANELTELTRTSLLAMNVAELTAEESVTLLISSMKQFNMTAEDTITILDAANEVSNNFAVSAKSVLEAISVSGQVAKNAGISMNELIGYIASLSEATGRSGTELGNAIRSIIAFSQRPKAIEVFKNIGVDVVDAEGNFRNFTQVFTELSQEWNNVTEEQIEQFNELGEELGLVAEGIGNLTDVEKAEVAQAGANLFRRNYFISLMEHMATATNATAVATDSLGSAQRENEKLMDSYVKKVEQLKASFEQLAVTIGDSGLLDLMKGLVDGTRNIIETFNSFPEPVKSAVISMGALASVLGIINVGMKTFMGISLGTALNNIAKAASKAASEIKLLNAASGIGGISKVATSLSAIGKTISKALGPAGWVLTAGTILVGATGAIQGYNRASERSTEIEKQQREEIKKLLKEYDNLERQLNESKGGTQEYLDINEKLKQVMQNIADISPGLVNAWDEQGRAVSVAKGRFVEFNNQLQLTKEQIDGVRLAIARFEVDQAKSDFEKSRNDYVTKLHVQGPRIKSEKEWLEGMGQLPLSGYVPYLDKDIMDAQGAMNAAERAQKAAEARLNSIEQSINAKSFGSSAGGGTTGIGSGTTVADIYARRYAELRHKLTMDDISTKEYIADLQTLAADMQAAGVELSRIWQIQEEIHNLQAQQSTPFQAALSDFNFQSQFGMPLVQQLNQLRQLREEFSTTAQERQDLDLRIYQLEQQLASEGIDWQERIRSARQGNIDVLEQQYQYLTREGATLEELNQADAVRMQLLDLYAQKQLEYQHRIEEQEQIITDAKNAQERLNTSTKEGQLEYNRLNSVIATAQQEQAKLRGETIQLAQSQNELNNALSSQSRQLGEAIEKAEDYYNRGLISLKQYISMLDDAQKSAWITAQQMQIVNRLMGEALATEWEQQIETALNEARDVFENNMEDIEESIEKVRTALEDFRDAVSDVFDDMQENQRSYDMSNLVSDLAEAGEKLRDLASGNEPPLVDFEEVLEGLPGKLLDTADAIDMVQSGFFDFEDNLTGLSIDQFVSQLRSGVGFLQMTAQEVNSMLQDIADERDQVISAIDAEIQSVYDDLDIKLSDLQEQLDALDEEEKAESREDAEKKHNERMAELDDQRRYHELRTGKEHEDAIKEIDKKKEEEEQRWSQQQKDWERDDERQRIRGEMDEARETAEEEVARLEDLKETAIQQYDTLLEILQLLKDYFDGKLSEQQETANNRVESEEEKAQDDIAELEDEKEKLRDEWYNTENGVIAIFEQGILDTIATIAAHDADFENRGELLIDALIKGIKNKRQDWQDVIADFMDLYQEAQEENAGQVGLGGNTGGGSGEGGGNPFVEREREAGSHPKHDNIQNYLQSLGYGGIAADEIANQVVLDGSSTLEDGSVIKLEDDGSVTIDGEPIPGAAQGALVTRHTLMQLGEFDRPEVVLPLDRAVPVLSDALSMSFNQNTGFTQAINQAADRIIVAIEKRSGIQIGTLFNSEQTSFADDLDVEIFSRELARAVRQVR